MASSARPPTRVSSPGATRRPSFMKPRSVRPARSVPPNRRCHPCPSRRRSQRVVHGWRDVEIVIEHDIEVEEGGRWRLGSCRLPVPWRHARGARGPRCPRQGRCLADRWPRPEGHQPRQGAVQAAPTGRRPDHQARADPLLRHDRADDPAAPQGPAAQPESISERSRRAQFLAEEHQGNRPEVADPLARNRCRRSHRPRRQRPPHRRRARRPGVAGEPGELRDPCLDRKTARSVAAGLRLHRHRSGREDHVGRHAGPRAAVPRRARTPRRPRLPQDHRQARHPDLDPDRAQVRLP